MASSSPVKLKYAKKGAKGPGLEWNLPPDKKYFMFGRIQGKLIGVNDDDYNPFLYYNDNDNEVEMKQPDDNDNENEENKENVENVQRPNFPQSILEREIHEKNGWKCIDCGTTNTENDQICTNGKCTRCRTQIDPYANMVDIDK